MLKSLHGNKYMTDPISDMLTIIRNGLMVNKESVDVPYSKLKLQIAEILNSKELIKDIKKIKRKEKKFIKLFLKYDKDKNPVISALRRKSKPGQRVYVGAKEIKKVRAGYGLAIVSTSKGLMTGQEARKQNLGGELICEIW